MSILLCYMFPGFGIWNLHQTPKRNGSTWSWTRISKTVSQDKPFLFISLLSQVVCYSIGILTNTGLYPYLYVLVSYFLIPKSWLLAQGQKLESTECFGYGIVSCWVRGWNHTTNVYCPVFTILGIPFPVSLGTSFWYFGSCSFCLPSNKMSSWISPHPFPGMDPCGPPVYFAWGHL